MLLAYSVIDGKVKILPDVQYVQQTHGESISSVKPRIADRKNLQEHYRRFREGLVTELVAMTNLTLDEAGRVVDENFHIVPGSTQRKRKKSLQPGKRIARELNRLRDQFMSLLDRHLKIRRHAEGVTVIQDAQLFPEDIEYQKALKLIVDYPVGIPGQKSVLSLQRSA